MCKHKINPSKDFTARTMREIGKLERQHRYFSNGAVALLIFSPLLVREFWYYLFMGHDFFSAGHWPLGGFVVSAYGFFISTLAFYVLLGGAAVMVAFYFLISIRRLSSFARSINQIFSQGRLKI